MHSSTFSYFLTKNEAPWFLPRSNGFLSIFFWKSKSLSIILIASLLNSAEVNTSLKIFFDSSSGLIRSLEMISSLIFLSNSNYFLDRWVSMPPSFFSIFSSTTYSCLISFSLLSIFWRFVFSYTAYFGIKDYILSLNFLTRSSSCAFSSS